MYGDNNNQVSQRSSRIRSNKKKDIIEIEVEEDGEGEDGEEHKEKQKDSNGTRFDLFYYDGLLGQDQEIRLTIGKCMENTYSIIRLI